VRFEAAVSVYKFENKFVASPEKSATLPLQVTDDSNELAWK
jgi:hypothetical protein